jgi:hypothetical protein
MSNRAFRNLNLQPMVAKNDDWTDLWPAPSQAPEAPAPVLPKTLHAFNASWLEIDAAWRHVGAEGPAPPRSLLNLSQMRSYLGSVMLIDVGAMRDNPDRNAYRFRVFGTAVAPIFGADFTAYTVADLPEKLAPTIEEIFDRVLSDGAPCRFRFSITEPASARHALGMACPMTRDAQSVDVILAMTVVEDYRWDPLPYL